MSTPVQPIVLRFFDVVQMTSNIADAEVAEMMADGIRKRGGHVFRAVPAGVLIAALELIKKPEQVR